jgi:hypothetical protein
VVSGRSRRTKTIGFRVPVEAYSILEYLARAQGISPHELARRIVLAWLRAKGYLK